MNRLVIAPHADDEAYGCGGLIAKYGGEATICVVADMNLQRADELKASMAAYTVRPEFTCLGLPDGDVGHNPSTLVRLLDEVIAETKAQEVYLPYPGVHQDHVAVYEASMRSIRLSMSDSHWFPRSVFVYDVPVYDQDLYPSHWRWNVFEALRDEHVEAKAAAVSAYESQAPAGAHPANGVREQAAAIGHPRGVAWAEQYSAVRMVRR
jgi:LmbE family N-acetylglucosaminyl deacetylase